MTHAGGAPIFESRRAAGVALALHLCAARIDFDVVVGVPSGGAVVAQAVADSTESTFALCPAARILADNHKLSLGAIAGWDAEPTLDSTIAAVLGFSATQMRNVLGDAFVRLHHQRAMLRKDLFETAVAGQTVLIVDDGIATGTSIIAVASAVSRLGPNSIHVSSPVIGSYGYASLIGCGLTPNYLYCGTAAEFSVPSHYVNFDRVTIEQAIELAPINQK